IMNVQLLLRKKIASMNPRLRISIRLLSVTYVIHKYFFTLLTSTLNTISYFFHAHPKNPS
ncbi:MAG: hypothetical protein ACPLN2_07205, partial [Thermoproteota archaeon]